MIIRHTQLNEINKVTSLLDEAKAYFKSQNIDQWQNGYPNETDILEDIKNNYSYVLLDNDEIVGTMFFGLIDEKTYHEIDGAWKSNNPYGVIHRIMITNKYKGKGYANKLLEFAMNQCLENNYTSLRIDTHKDNLSMQRFLLKNNFEKCGIIRVEDNSERIAFERILK